MYPAFLCPPPAQRGPMDAPQSARHRPPSLLRLIVVRLRRAPLPLPDLLVVRRLVSGRHLVQILDQGTDRGAVFLIGGMQESGFDVAANDVVSLDRLGA